jgi:hypothetical protein
MCVCDARALRGRGIQQSASDNPPPVRVIQIFRVDNARWLLLLVLLAMSCLRAPTDATPGCDFNV